MTELQEAPAYLEPVKIPKPKDSESEAEESQKTEVALPQTLVRIPTEHAPMLQQASSGGGESTE
jgi:DASH complex subunit DAD2